MQADNWRKILTEHIKQTDWQSVRRDVAPFLESAADLALLEKDILLAQLKDKN